MKRHKMRQGFTLIELLVVVAIIALLIAILIPSLSRAKELANRAACGASLTGVVKSMILYSADNYDSYPIVVAGTSGSWGGQPNSAPVTSATQQAVIATYYTGASPAQAGDPMANLWLLVLNGNVSPKQFLCKSDPGTPTPAALSPNSGQFNSNFASTGSSGGPVVYSYGWAYMWDATPTQGGWWKNTVDSSLPIGSDVSSQYSAGVSDPGATGATYKLANSKNHSGGEGQEVVFGDAHVEFDKNPTVGQAADNIFEVGVSGTAAAGNTTGSAKIGTTVATGSQGNYDIIMVPARQSTGNGW